MLEGPRAAGVEELPQVIRLTSRIFGFEKHGILLDEVFPHVFCEENIENIRVIVSDGQVVSHAAIWEGWLNLHGLWLKTGLLGVVCTHPRYRRRGYASILVKDALRKMAEDRVDLVMISGARTLYSRAGCIEAGILYIYRIPVDFLKHLSKAFGGLKAEQYKEEMVSDLATIYQREPVRFRRSLEEFKLLTGRRVADLKVFIAYWRDKPVSYVSMLEGRLNLWGSSTVVEYAGSRIAVLQTLYEASKTTEFKRIRLAVPYGDQGLISLLETSGLKPETSEAPASLGILNPLAFAEKIRPYVEERLGVEAGFKVEIDEGVVKVYASDSCLRLSDSRAFTLFVFGKPKSIRNPDIPRFEPDKVPEVFKRGFPMPPPVYGLNYL